MSQLNQRNYWNYKSTQNHLKITIGQCCSRSIQMNSHEINPMAKSCEDQDLPNLLKEHKHKLANQTEPKRMWQNHAFNPHFQAKHFALILASKFDMMQTSREHSVLQHWNNFETVITE